MRLIIAGGRDRRITKAGFAYLDRIHAEHTVTQVISGGARGVDRDGEAWGKERLGKENVRRFSAQWARYGRQQAGHKRNREMAIHGDAVALFLGGNGTRNMRHWAAVFSLRVFDFERYKETGELEEPRQLDED